MLLFGTEKPIPRDDLDKLYEAIGKCVIAFGAIDIALAYLLARLLSTDDAAATAVIAANRSVDAKIEVVGSVLDFRFGDSHPDFPILKACTVIKTIYSKIVVSVRKTKKMRNTMAHGAIYVGEKQSGETYVRLIEQITYTSAFKINKLGPTILPGHGIADVQACENKIDDICDRIMRLSEVVAVWGQKGPKHADTQKAIRELAAYLKMDIPENLTDLETPPPPRSSDQ